MSDIYSFGIVACELLANVYPYTEYQDLDELGLTIKICQGLRPNMDELKIPQVFKDVIEKCWDADPIKRPSAEKLEEDFYKNLNGIENLNVDFSYELFSLPPEVPYNYEAIEKDYNCWSQSTPYKMHSAIVPTSKKIDTNEINSKLSEDLESLRITDTIKTNQEQNNWTNIHPNFTEKLTQSWTNRNFNYFQTQEWINIGLQPADYNFCAWLRDTKQLTPEQVLNHYNLEQLNQEFFNWWQTQQQAQIEQPPK